MGQELGRIIFSPSGDKRYKMQGMQMALRDLLAKSSERDVTMTEYKMPQVFVPEK